jgi:protein gp37
MSKIEWLARPETKPETWNMIGGCTPISAGCTNCYAARLAAGRLQHHPRYVGTAEMHNGKARWTGKINLDHKALDIPLRWKKPRTVFPCSMSDLFHSDVPDDWHYKVFKIMAATDQHTYLILTKRPKAMLEFCQTHWHRDLQSIYGLHNVWLGVSVENQTRADERRAAFEATPAAIKFVSYEPALGPIDWSGWEFIDMLIFGGESGPGAKPAHPDWFRDTLNWCRENGIAPFFKQWGKWMPAELWDEQFLPKRCSILRFYTGKAGWYGVGKKRAGHLLDGKVIREWPEPCRP